MISHDSCIASYCRLWCSQTYSSSHILRVQTTSISGTCRTSRMRMAMSTVCAVAFGAVQDMRPDSDGHLKHSTRGQETRKQTRQNCRYLAFHFLHSLHDIFSTFFFFFRVLRWQSVLRCLVWEICVSIKFWGISSSQPSSFFCNDGAFAAEVLTVDSVRDKSGLIV